MIGPEQKNRIADNRVSLSFLFAIAFLALTALTGWYFHIPALIHVISDSIAMQFNTAICFILLAICGVIKILHPERRVVFGIAGAFVFAIGVLTVFEYTSGTTIGID